MVQIESDNKPSQAAELATFVSDLQTLLGSILISVVRFDSLMGLASGLHGDALLLVVSGADAGQARLLLSQLKRSSKLLLGSTSIDVETLPTLERALDLGDPLVVHLCRSAEVLVDPVGEFGDLQARSRSGGPELTKDQLAGLLKTKSAQHMQASAAWLNRAVVELYASVVLWAKHLDASELAAPVQFVDLARLDWTAIRNTLVGHGLSKREIKPIEDLHMLLSTRGHSDSPGGPGIDLFAMVKHIQRLHGILAP